MALFVVGSSPIIHLSFLSPVKCFKVYFLLKKLNFCFLRVTSLVVEHFAYNEKVGGSIPSLLIYIYNVMFKKFYSVYLLETGIVIFSVSKRGLEPLSPEKTRI